MPPNASAPVAMPQPGAFTPGYRTYVLILLLLVYTTNYADRIVLGVLLEPIKNEFGASDTLMGFLTGATFAIFYATLGIPIAILADRTNRRNIIGVCVFIWSAMTVLCGMAATFLQMMLARIGVGVGEAGGSPPSHSMISDMFPQEKRATALGIFAMGVPLGFLVGYYGGSVVSESYGWRMAFYAMGVPGIILTVLVFLTVKEPPRGSHGAVDATRAPSLMRIARYLSGRKSIVHTLIGATLITFSGYSIVIWGPAFFIRTHQMAPVDVGTYLALAGGGSSMLGTFLGGYFADKLSRNDKRWQAWVVAVAIVVAIPFAVGVALLDDLETVLWINVIPAMVSALYLAPCFAIMQNLVEPRMRAVASAIFLFVINLIGMGIGPVFTGWVSDLLAPQYGADSLRYAFVLLVVFNIWAVWHFIIAGRHLPADYARVGQH